MAEPPPYPSTGDDTAGGAGSGPAARRSRRVTALWIIGIGLVAVLFVVLHLTGVFGPGSHG